MSKENEMWREDSEEGTGASRDGNKSFNRENNYNQDGNYNRERSERPYRSSYDNRNNDGERPARPRFTREGGSSERPRFTREGGGSDRPRFTREGGNNERPRYNNNNDRPHRSYNHEGNYNRDNNYNREGSYNREGNYNREGGERSYNSDRPYRPSFNRDRNFNREDKPWRQNTEEGGERTFRRPTPNSAAPTGNSYSQERGEGGFERPRRPRLSSGGGDNRGGYGDNRGGYNNNRGGYDNNRSGGYGNNRGGGYNNNRGGGYGNNGGYQQRPMRRHTDDYDPNAKYSKKKQIEYKEQYVDPNEPIRLNKFLANAGICSRREADEFITAGAVSVNGEVVIELGTKIKRADEVKFHDQPVSIERKVYVVLNKPKNCVTTSDDPQERKTVMDLVKGACNERIYPVGRLDRNTTGVLLLTNDGDLASKLTHPQFMKKKIYHVYLDKNLTKADMDQILAGIELEDGEIHADAISYASDNDKSQVGIEIHSGKNRIVRRIFEKLGYKVIKLDRVFFAGLTKKNLRRGDWRFLSEQEVNFLRMGSFE